MSENDLKKELEILLEDAASFEVNEIEADLVAVFDKVEAENETSPQIKEAVFYILSELSDNVKQHSKASKCWVLYKKDKDNLIILISDNGIGIPAVFEEHFPDLHEDDLEKIREALEKGVSTKGEGRGYGLRTVRGIINAAKGKMIFISGGVGYKVTENKKEPLKQDITGTLALIEIPVDAKLESDQFYNIVEGKNERN